LLLAGIRPTGKKLMALVFKALVIGSSMSLQHSGTGFKDAWLGKEV
jgi:hypothetical protein